MSEDLERRMTSAESRLDNLEAERDQARAEREHMLGVATRDNASLRDAINTLTKLLAWATRRLGWLSVLAPLAWMLGGALYQYLTQRPAK